MYTANDIKPLIQSVPLLLTMRNLSVYMQCFCDIADYIEATPDPKLDMTDLMPIMIQRSLHLR